MKKVQYIVIIALAGLLLFSSVLTDAARAQEKKLVKLGFIGPLTGPNAAVGLGARNSADLAVRQANEKGNLPFKLELVVLDDASDPTTGVARHEALQRCLGHGRHHPLQQPGGTCHDPRFSPNRPRPGREARTSDPIASSSSQHA